MRVAWPNRQGDGRRPGPKDIYWLSCEGRRNGRDTHIQISRWGDSLGLRLPRTLAEQIGVTAGEKVDVIAEGDTLVVRAIKPRWRIEDLVANMTPETMSSAFRWGNDAGREEVDV